MDVLADLKGAADGAGWPVEAGQEAVACGVDLSPMESIEQAADDAVMLVEQIMPPAIAKLGSPLRRADDIGEQHSGEHPIGFRCWAHAGQELLDFVNDRVWIAEDRDVVRTRQLDELGVWDPLGDGSSLGNI